jgi:hypothetical protein
VCVFLCTLYKFTFCTHLTLGLEETVGYVWTQNSFIYSPTISIVFVSSYIKLCFPFKSSFLNKSLSYKQTPLFILGNARTPAKALPLQAWSGPEGSRKLRFPDFTTTAQNGGKFVSLTHRPHLPPRKYSRYSFLLETESTPWP